MERREFLRISGIGLASVGPAVTGQPDAAGEEPGSGAAGPGKVEERSAGICGLYCDACSEKAKDRCHGCGCGCGNCTASKHRDQCSLYACATERSLVSCADCKDLPCSKLIMHTCDPLFPTSAPCIENLRRQKAIGPEGWIAEQQAYWADEDHLRKQHYAEQVGQKAIWEMKEKTGYKKLW